VAIELVDELVVVRGAVDAELNHRIKERYDGERGPRRRGNLADVPLHVGTQEAAVEREHLAVQPVQGAEPEVAVLGKLGEREVAVEVALEQRVQRGGLEDDVRLVLRVQPRTPHRLHVQAADEPIVDEVARRGLHGAQPTVLRAVTRAGFNGRGQRYW